VFHRIEDFEKTYAQQVEMTGKVLATLTDQNLAQPVAEGHRTLGHIAWHVVATVPEMMNRTGLGLSSIDQEAPPPTVAREIIDGYQKVTSELLQSLKENWTDETLGQVDDMYGMKWPRSMTLRILIDHEIHHRGQMTVLLRQAGAKVPGVMGPSKEEWTAFGMDAPAY